MVSLGGKRVRSGRHRRDTVRVECSILRPVYEELIRCETVTGVYRTKIAATILTEQLIGGMVERELAMLPGWESDTGGMA